MNQTTQGQTPQINIEPYHQLLLELPNPTDPNSGIRLARFIVQMIQTIDPAWETTIAYNNQTILWWQNGNDRILLSFTQNEKEANELAPEHIRNSPVVLLAQTASPIGIYSGSEHTKQYRYVFLAKERGGSALLYEMTSQGMSDHFLASNNWIAVLKRMFQDIRSDLVRSDMDTADLRDQLNLAVRALDPTALI
ncbi:MAG: hypothetical protein WC477_04590 [Patescibacteria group bacterium]